jgi:glycosyltransferase involved in cell wall biosynthesis
MRGTVVVIPAFNEVETITTVVTAACSQAPERVVVVDDGSADGTAALVCGLIASARCPCPLELIRHRTNQGKGFALASGIARALAAGARRIITLDADGQHDGADLPRLEHVAELDPAAVVIAARTRDRERAPPLRRFANGVADFWISWACGQRIEDTQSGFRLYPADLLARLAARPRRGQGFAFETLLLINGVHLGARVRSVPITTRYDQHARPSHYRPWRDTWSIIRLVGGKLLRRGMYPGGLVRVLSHARQGAGGQSPSVRDSD